MAATEDVKWRGAGGRGNCSSAGGVPSERSEGGDGVSSVETKDENVFVDRAFHFLRSSWNCKILPLSDTPADPYHGPQMILSDLLKLEMSRSSSSLSLHLVSETSGGGWITVFTSSLRLLGGALSIRRSLVMSCMEVCAYGTRTWAWKSRLTMERRREWI